MQHLAVSGAAGGSVQGGVAALQAQGLLQAKAEPGTAPEVLPGTNTEGEGRAEIPRHCAHGIDGTPVPGGWQGCTKPRGAQAAVMPVGQPPAIPEPEPRIGDVAMTGVCC